jgi:hypothetical protein
MHKLPVVAEAVLEYNMDKTLKDYIDRTTKNLNKESEKENKEDQYPVLPKDDDTDSKRNPYGNH